MAWITIKEYIQRFRISDSTIRRHIRTLKVKIKREGSKIFIWLPDEPAQDENVVSSPEDDKKFEVIKPKAYEFQEQLISKGVNGTIADLIAFSSKALNSYLMISDKLAYEKDKRIQEREAMIRDHKQKISELESYIKMLEEQKRYYGE